MTEMGAQSRRSQVGWKIIPNVAQRKPSMSALRPHSGCSGEGCFCLETDVPRGKLKSASRPLFWQFDQHLRLLAIRHSGGVAKRWQRLVSVSVPMKVQLLLWTSHVVPGARPRWY